MALADTITAYLTAALSGNAEYPPEVLREQTLEQAAALGRALLTLLDPASQPSLAGPMAYLTADPESGRARKTVCQRLRHILVSAPQLAADAQQLTAQFTAQVTGSGDADAITDLGYLLSQLGDEAGAEDAYRAAAELGSADAMVSLGHLRLGKRDLAGARAIFQSAITSPAGDIALTAMLEMARLHLMTGDTAATRAAYQQVIDSGHPQLAHPPGRPCRHPHRPGADEPGSTRR
jgi:tetratricopeptide (TPR) repeat protein